jgi:hypothetical protein
MNNPTPFFAPWRPRLAPAGRRCAQTLQPLRQATLSQIEDRLAPALPAGLLLKPAAGDHSRQQVFTLARTWWCWVWQVLQANTSCREVVRQVQALLALGPGPELEGGNSAYCQARAKLPLSLLEKAFAASAQSAEGRARPGLRLQGRPLKVVDGSGAHLADTPSNRAGFPPNKSQRPGGGFPYLRVVALFSAASGALLAKVTGSLRSSELSLFLAGLRSTLRPKDILLGDRAYGVYVVAALLQCGGVDLLARVSVRNRKVDFRRAHQRLGPLDALFIWSKPKTPSPMIALREWLGLPSQITVRVLRVRVVRAGFRTRQLTLVTTLLDAALYPAAQLQQAYARRWRMELCLDDLKTTLGMQSLRCLTPAMVEKELLLFLTAHNFLRWIMAQAAHGQNAPLERISFKGSLDAFRQWTQALAQLGHAKSKRPQRRRLWQRLLQTLGKDLVPDRPGRKEPRAVKKRSKYPHLNKSRHRYREPWSRNKRRRLARAKRKAFLI